MQWAQSVEIEIGLKVEIGPSQLCRNNDADEETNDTPKNGRDCPSPNDIVHV